MTKPIAVKGQGVCFAFPDVCMTPAPPGSPVPVPYPNLASLADTKGTTKKVLVADKEVILDTSSVEQSTGDEMGSGGGIRSKTTKGKVRFMTSSESVLIEDAGVVRMLDRTSQNDGNAQGLVLGGVPTVLIGD